MAHKSSSNKKTSFFSKLNSSKKLSLLVFAAVFALIGSVLYYQLSAAPKNRVTGISLYLTPSGQTVSVGNELNLQVWVDVTDKFANAVQANLSYDTTYLDFVSIDATASNFEIEAQATGGNGSVGIARGTTTPVSGKKLIATVKFRAKASSRKTSVTFATGSAVIDSQTALDILVGRVNGSYRIR